LASHGECFCKTQINQQISQNGFLRQISSTHLESSSKCVDGGSLMDVTCIHVQKANVENSATAHWFVR